MRFSVWEKVLGEVLGEVLGAVLGEALGGVLGAEKGARWGARCRKGRSVRCSLPKKVLGEVAR